jgi:hypothetical protein
VRRRRRGAVRWSIHAVYGRSRERPPDLGPWPARSARDRLSESVLSRQEGRGAPMAKKKSKKKDKKKGKKKK